MYKHKIIYLATFMCFCMLGGILSRSRTRWTDTRMPNGNSVSLDDCVINQKLIGNDCIAKKLFIPVNVHDEAECFIDVTIAEGVEAPYRTILFKERYTSDSARNQNGISIKLLEKRLRYDRDYYITLEKNGTGIIDIPCADMDYISLYKGETALQQCIAYTIGYEKQNPLFGLWKFLFISFGLTFGLGIIFRQSFFHSLGSTVFLLSAILYIMGLAGLVKYIVSVCFAVALFGWGLVIQFLVKKKELPDYFSHIGLDIACYALILCIFAIHDLRLVIHAWDECSHWATAVKNMYMYDSMYIHKQSSVVVFRYPPLYTLFQYWTVKVFGRYSVCFLHFGKHFLETSLLLFCLDKLKQHRGSWISCLFIVLAVIELPDLAMSARAYDYLYNSVYADITLGCVFAAFLFSCIDTAECPGLRQCMELFILTVLLILTKDNGMILWAACLLGAAGVMIFRLVLKKKALNRNEAVMITISLAAFVFARMSWELYVSSHVQECLDIGAMQQVDTQKAIGVSANSLWQFLTLRAERSKYRIAFKHLSYALVECCYQQFAIKYSFGMLILAMLGALRFSSRDGKVSKLLELQCHVFIITCAIGMYVIYTLFYVFSIPDGINVPSFHRYYGSLLIGMLLWEIIWICNHVKNAKKVMACFICCTVIFSCFFYHIWQSIVHPVKINTYDERALSLRKNLQESDRVFYVSSGDNGGIHVKYMYYAAPIRLNKRLLNDESGSLYVGYIPRISEPKMYEYQLSVKEFINRLNDYQYVAIDKSDKQFIADYGSLFEDSIEDGWIYKVSNTKKLKKYCQYYKDMEVR